jgi:PEP-CTERM motif
MRWMRALSLSVLLAAAPAAALPTINIDQGTGAGQAGGTLTYDGAGGPLIGGGIGFGVLAGFDTAANAGVSLFCVPNCTLGFQTGPNTAEAVGLPGGVEQWTWAGGGTFVLEGTLNTASDGTGTEVATGTLLTGAFDAVSGVVGTEGRLLVVGIGEDRKIAELLQFYGLPAFLPFRFANTEIVASGLTVDPDGSLSGEVTNADLTNTGIPEPGTLLLFGSGAAGLAFVRRWRRR